MIDLTPTQIARIAVAAEKRTYPGRHVNVPAEEVLALCEMARAKMLADGKWPARVNNSQRYGLHWAEFAEVIAGEGGRT